MNIDMKPFVEKVQKMKARVVVDIQRYSFTVFKNTFRQKTRLKEAGLSGDARTAYLARKSLNSKTGKTSTRSLLAPSEPGTPPRQDKRRYLSNSVRYINTPNSTTVYLDVPWSKTLDEGGQIQVRQRANPFSWMNLDVLKYSGILYFGRLLKSKNTQSFPMIVSDKKARPQSTRNQITWFATARAQVIRVSKQTQLVNHSMARRPFIEQILSKIVSSGIINRSLERNKIR